MDCTAGRDFHERPDANLTVASAGLAALSALLLCVDETRWASMARPSAECLGLLIADLNERLEAAIAGGR